MPTSTREAALPFQRDFSPAELSNRRRKLLPELREGLVVLAAG